MTAMRRQTIDGKVIESDNKIGEGKRIQGSGTITRTWNHPDEFVAPSKAMCSGCEDDFYNDHNPYGVKECWAYATSVVVNKVGYATLHVCNGPNVKMVK